MKLREYLLEMTKYSKKQKDELSHNILNILMDPNAAKMLRKIRGEAENITLSKKEAESILNNLKRIRQIIIDLPLED
jgi:hypothetical protein